MVIPRWGFTLLSTPRNSNILGYSQLFNKGISRGVLVSFSTTSISRSATLQRSAFLEAIQQHDPEQKSVIHSSSDRSFRYGDLLYNVATTKERLLRATGKSEMEIAGERISFLVENSYDYVVTLLAAMSANAVAVPLAPSFPPSELRYIINQSKALALVFSDKFSGIAREVLEDGLNHMPVEVPIPKISEKDNSIGEPVHLTGNAEDAGGGLMLYTSGTTAQPKGVLLPQKALIAQCRSLLQAWEYSPKDLVLHVLPLHHIHGVVNALLAPLLAGSTIEFMFPFNAEQVWKRLASPFLPDKTAHQRKKSVVTLFTAVPTIWSRMLRTHPHLPQGLQNAAKEAIMRRNLRLNISGSAALPMPIKKAWTELSNGNVLLERYGMTEVGMALSSGLVDEDRIDGAVGWPLPSVEVRLLDLNTREEIQTGEEFTSDGKERAGEIQLRGPTIFHSYFNNEQATSKAFTSNGWFMTGDIAVRKPVLGSGQGLSGPWAQGSAYFILGRESADIIKTGGELVSALEIERELLSLPEVEECAVVGIPSEIWGQKPAAVIVLSDQGKRSGKNGKPWSALDMRRALKYKLVTYKLPHEMKVIQQLPRNAMGKVNKRDLAHQLFGDRGKTDS